MLGPENYSGETFEEINFKEVPGRWELILLDDEDNCLKKSKIVLIKEFQDLLGEYKMYRCSDYENGKETIAITGYTEDNVCYWMKKL